MHEVITRLQIMFAQLAANEAVEAHTHTDRERDHQHLNRICERNCGQGIGIEAGNENAVYNIIQSLYQHGNHYRDRDRWDQSVHWHSPKHF